ncbi:MAG: polysaccharide lyase [Candidatus Hydrogenedentes bacterium]|nr:polysaccharide lyase [Candidatus Hydrogenedentota bacterium]
MKHRIAWSIVLFAACGQVCGLAAAAEPLTRGEAEAALHKAAAFFIDEVSPHGGYVWAYSANLDRREGEGKATASMAWVQPPGTPSVGRAFLTACEATGDTYYLDAARRTAYALVQGQLRSGGWDYRIEFDPDKRGKYAYRVEPSGSEGSNVSTLDDDTTQAALRYLMQADRALDFKDEAIHEAVLYGLDCLLKAQYPIGAWPQRYASFPDPEKWPVLRASYPDSWSREYEGISYAAYYTFNDNTIADTIRTMFEAGDTYEDDRYRAAARKAGDFILLAQMPDPQPAWAQQYDAGMHPAWARKFEPPAVTGGESQGVMRVLLSLYRETGDAKYLEPIPRAIAYLRASQLPNGRLARFYELQTNTPLYFTKDYTLTYSSDDMPTHYSFIVGSNLDAIEAEYKAVQALDPSKLKPSAPRTPKMSQDVRDRARAAVDAMDERGAWVQDGRLRYHGADDPTSRVIESATFIRNVAALSAFIAAAD